MSDVNAYDALHPDTEDLDERSAVGSKPDQEMRNQPIFNPLVWRGSVASTPWGEYIVDRDLDGDVSSHPWCCWSPANEGTNLGHFASRAEAESAATADYQARTIACLCDFAESER